MHYVILGLIFLTVNLASAQAANEAELAALERSELKHKCKILKRLKEQDLNDTSELAIERRAEIIEINKDINSNPKLKEACN